MLKKRIWEIDFFRGLAIILMVFFNYSFALDYFRIYTVTEGWLFWWLFPRIVGGSFIFLAGVAFAISYSKTKRQRKIRRGIEIFCLGLLITLLTSVLPSGAVLFGVLHLIGLSVILSLFFIRFEKLNLLLGLLIIAAGFYLETFTFEFPWLLWLGFVPSGFFTLDYFPLLPWFGFMLLGLFFGKKLYGKRTSKAKHPAGSGLFCLLGRHSLFVYLMHIPILIAALYALGLF